MLSTFLRHKSFIITLMILMFGAVHAQAQISTSVAQETEKTLNNEDNWSSGPTPKDGFVRAWDTYHACKRFFGRTFINRENIARKSHCLGYFFGVGSTLLDLQRKQVRTGICLPQEASVEAIMKSFVKWGEVNLESLKDKFTTSAVLEALTSEYPCY